MSAPNLETTFLNGKSVIPAIGARRTGIFPVSTIERSDTINPFLLRNSMMA
jgi:hypothetical protein